MHINNKYIISIYTKYVYNIYIYISSYALSRELIPEPFNGSSVRPRTGGCSKLSQRIGQSATRASKRYAKRSLALSNTVKHDVFGTLCLHVLSGLQDAPDAQAASQMPPSRLPAASQLLPGAPQMPPRCLPAACQTPPRCLPDAP